MEICENQRKNVSTLLILFSASLALASIYYLQLDYPNYEDRYQIHNEILNGEIDPPYRHRILVPYTTNLSTSIFEYAFSTKGAFLLSYLLYDFFAIFFSLTAQYYFLKIFFSEDHSLIGTLFVSSVMPITFAEPYQPWSLLEPGLFSLSLILMHEKRYYSLFPVLIIATLNRATAVFIPIMFFLVHLDFQGGLKVCVPRFFKKYFLKVVVLFLIWMGVRGSLWVILGKGDEWVKPLEEIFLQNINWEYLRMASIKISIFFGACWIFAILGIKTAPAFIKRASLVIPIYLFVIGVWGIWIEIRLLTPLYPLLTALMLSFVYPCSENKNSTLKI
jgi:hypothetical protein